MPEQIQRILNRIREWWLSFNSRQKVIIASIAGVLIVAFAILGYAFSRPTKVNLITCSSASEASEVMDLLDGESISYTTSSDGMTFYVNSSDQATATILLGSNSIPTNGYSLDDALDGSFTSTESDKTKKYQLYLEEKFASDLESISCVSSATVTLSIPNDDGTLISQAQDSYASVILNLSSEMDESTAASIAKYIATELGNDGTDNIVILDGNGNLLYSGGDETSSAGIASSNISATQKAESNVASSIKSVLLATNVYDNAEVAVNLDIDYSTESTISYMYSTTGDNEQGLLDSRTTYESETVSGSGGTPGTTSNDDDTTYVLDDYDTRNSTNTETTEDFLPNETITTTEGSSGTINYDTSSVTVTLTNYVTYSEDTLEANGTLAALDMTFDEFVAANSDRVKTVVDDEFYDMVANASGISTDNITIVAYEIPMFQYSSGSSRTVTDYLEIILAVLIFALLGFIVLRSMRGEKEEELAEEISVEALLEAQEESLEDIGFEEKSEARILIEKFVDENPEAVAALLRNWLNDDWG